MAKNNDKIKGINTTESELNLYVQLLKRGKQDFKIIKSNYTIELISNLFNIKLNTVERKGAFFQAQKKILADIQESEEKSHLLGNEPNPKYFKIYNLKEMQNRTVYAFDISGAYPTALREMDLIKKETYNYLMQVLNKTERLPAIGSIATKKTIQYFYSGELGDIEIIESKYRPIFFHVVETVYNLMDYVQEYMYSMHNTKSLFSWVDCIYLDVTDFKPEIREAIAVNIMHEFSKYMYKTKLEILHNFNCEEKKHYYKLQYLKNGEIKKHNVPKSDNPFSDKAHKILFGI